MSYNPGNYNEERKMNTQNLSREFKFNFLLAKNHFFFAGTCRIHQLKCDSVLSLHINKQTKIQHFMTH